MSDITHMPSAAAAGDRAAAGRVVAAPYNDLRRLSRKQMRPSGAFALLDTRGLVGGVWRRWAESRGRECPDRSRFLAYAAWAMCSVVTDRVRAQQAQMRGAGLTMPGFPLPERRLAQAVALRLCAG